MRRTVLTVAMVVAAMAAGLGVAGAQAGGTIYVVHGVPDLEADVYLDGALTLRGFGFGSVTDGLELPTGDYTLEVYPTGADPDADDPVLSAALTVGAGDDLSIVAHLGDGGDPMLTVYPNDLSTVEAGTARLIVRHTADAPAIDVRAAARPIVTDLSNPDQAIVESLQATTLPIDLVPTGTTDVVYGPADLELEAGMVYIAYAVGSLDDANLQVILQRREGGQDAAAAQTTTTTTSSTTSTTSTTTPPTTTTTAAPATTTTVAPPADPGGGGSGTPTAIPAGSGGLAGRLPDFPGWALVAAALAVAGVAGSGWVLVSRDRG
jgi:hypothetical protein